ncbi:ESX secretion-associated protein EspG [Nocardia sp. CDC159]|uniref:ESX secretion-associated protein EspG n=1 Tax=Nocardia pulmonis TaxID=2951408 RepID=A0A9X2E8H2_9NOCA|nr:MULTISPECIES: ESX secretion-associated protein EspG [Nocardia]MCM6774825.1 ESX secretion-associated protein EspG [Nocardia pulmonis]MCM6789756.1 ESX secretion-associated protein EspG [Nocardia sp. CDC159]
MKWVLTPDEFTHVWATETGLDRRPYPVNMIPAATARTESEYAALGLRHRYARNTDPDLTAALLLCARTDATTITISGERSDGAEPERILAFAAVVHHHAGILIGRPDAVVVRVCHARALGDELVEVIGSAPPGRHGAMREPQEAVLDSEDKPPYRTHGHRNAARFRRKLRDPVNSRGFITVTVAPDNPISPPTRHRTWLDFTGDGRYLLTTAADLSLTPCDDADLANHLTRLACIQ